MKEKLAETYMRERPRLIGWMRERVGLEEAEDVLHDVMVRSLINLDTLGGVRDLTAWLWQGVRNGVVDVWRKRARRKGSGETELADDDFDSFIDTVMAGVEDGVERDETLALLADAIGALPREQREVIVAQALGGETFQSVSDRTGVPVDTLAARKRYALARLRSMLADYMEG